MTANNYQHVAEGRACVSHGYAYSVGGNDLLGLWNIYVITSVQETSPGYWERVSDADPTMTTVSARGGGARRRAYLSPPLAPGNRHGKHRNDCRVLTYGEPDSNRASMLFQTVSDAPSGIPFRAF